MTGRHNRQNGYKRHTAKPPDGDSKGRRDRRNREKREGNELGERI
jgi:hypothetical protein